MSSCRETCVERACGAARRNRYAAGSLPARSGLVMRRRGETLLALGCGSGWRVRRLRDRLGAIRTHTRGSGHMGRGRGGELACAGRQWSASPIKIQSARPCRPAPLLIVHGDSRSASRPPWTFAVAPAGCAGVVRHRPPIAFAVSRRERSRLSSVMPTEVGTLASVLISCAEVCLDPGLRRDDGVVGRPAQGSKMQYCAFGNSYAGSPNGSQARHSRMTEEEFG